MEDDQKENNGFMSNKRVIRSPSRQSPFSHSVLGEIQQAVTNVTTPTKLIDAAESDPWTPTANLKMLISAASPEIRNRERGILEEQLSGDEFEKTLPSRKEKSLGLLCHKFLARYPMYPNPALNNSICLDEVAEELHVERRRIYDIVNVLESLHMVSRLAKNKYIWHGRRNLNKTFDALKKVGEDNKYAEQIGLIRKREPEESDTCEDSSSGNSTPRSLVKPTDVGFVELPGLEFRAASVNSRNEKSLRVMSQRFVMLFLVSKPQIVSLEVAAKMLIGEDQLEDVDKSKFKTKIRRLYDIANVLSSLDLIKKVHVTEEKGRKPAFQWIGPESFADENETKHLSSPTYQTPLAIDLRSPKEQCVKNLFAPRGKQNFTRHPSLIKLAKSIENDRRKINSAPASPVKTIDDNQNETVVPSKMSQLAAICKKQLEDSKHTTKIKLKMSRDGKHKVVAKPAINLENNQRSPCLSPSLPQTHGYIPICQAIPILHHQSSLAPSYAVYLQPTQGRTPPSQSPSAQGHNVPCADDCGNKNVLEVELDKNVSQDAVTKGGSMTWTEDRLAENETVSDKSPKRLSDPGNNCTTKRIKPSQEKMEPFPENLYPSGYLIPLQFASLGNDNGKNHAGSSPEQNIFTSPITGMIPVNASDMSTFPSLRVTPLKLMFSPGSLTTVPGVSQSNQPGILSPCISSQSPSQTMLSFTLQNRELITHNTPHSVSVSPISERSAEELQVASVLNIKHLSPVSYNGQALTLFSLQQPGVPLTPKGSQEFQESFFRTPGGLTSPAACNNDPQGSILVSQRKLDVGPDDTL
ncbi:transcription factor E2F8 [Bombina bombina]|uniref:transcription factor E2F8 n=1 Tax=Bombina bombina TaxID=8345 RepID=UPI00235A9F72|nr:transcription factor E2F8 [Bombina bombina]